jgi:hypothetical protein
MSLKVIYHKYSGYYLDPSFITMVTQHNWESIANRLTPQGTSTISWPELTDDKIVQSSELPATFSYKMPRARWLIVDANNLLLSRRSTHMATPYDFPSTHILQRTVQNRLYPSLSTLIACSNQNRYSSIWQGFLKWPPGVLYWFQCQNAFWKWNSDNTKGSQ